MEREKELAKLVNVLRRTSRLAMHSELTGGGQDAAAYCVDQYNRVLGRLKEIDPNIGTVFDSLPAGTSLGVVAMACRQVVAYFEDEVRIHPGWARAYGACFDPSAFRRFWKESSADLEDLGDFIRESVEAWARHHRQRAERREGGRSGPSEV